MGLLKPAINQTAYLKVGLQGFEGSGKTHLACDFAKELTKLVKGSKVAFFDTEKGSDFHIQRFQEAGVELHVIKSKSFMDLLTVIKESESEGYSFLIIDSITHVWRELTNAYMKKKGKTQISMKDWVTLKAEWAQFTQAYVNSKVHIAMCGRAGYEYDFDEDEDGKKEVVKSGTKMKAEGETGFEPDLLIETYKVALSEVLTDKKSKKRAKGFINRCVVIKDRSDTINGKIFDRPKFKDFISVIKFLNLGGEHIGTDASRTSEDLIKNSDRSWVERDRLKTIALEDLQTVLIKAQLDGTSKEAKEKRVAILEEIFGKASKTYIESLDLRTLEENIALMRQKLGLTGIAVSEPVSEPGSFDTF
ncbi:MAG: AAA family ATPase [Spirulinaceae cyanobacterium RM2_2_10]|nr:AAA family ATPase [Spirulinaceae cyanobacterium RM2_2_10]